MLAAIISALTAVTLGTTAQYTAKHTSILTGQMWLEDVLFGHPERCITQFGMSAEVFFRLLLELALAGLADTRWVTAAEQLTIFLYFVCHNASQRMLMEHFQRSAETVSKYVPSYLF